MLIILSKQLLANIQENSNFYQCLKYLGYPIFRQRDVYQ